MRQPGIQVLTKASAILRVCGARRTGLSFGDIAQALKLPRSTVQRIVTALVAEGMLQSDGSHRSIRIGPSLLALAMAHRIDVVEIAHPYLKELSHLTGETVDLALYKDDHLVFVDQVAGSHRLRTVSAVGETFPVHNTANGKAALSLLEGEELQPVLAKLQPYSNASQMLRELSSIREKGFAEDDEIHSPGISAVGTAFKIVTGEIYALSVPMPSIRYQSKRQTTAQLLLQTAEKITAACAARA